MDLQTARILVVGATGALGGRLASRLADRGSRLVLTGRRRDALAEVALQVRAEQTYPLDLVDVDACATTVRRAADDLGGLDGLLIASGVAAFGPAREDDDAVVEELFAVNTLGPMALVRAALPLMSPGGCVAVLTAVLADVPTAGMAAYSASKAALSAYLTAVRREVRRDKIAILDVRPPHLETGLAERALGPASRAPSLSKGADIDALVDLVVQGIVDGNRELVADLKAGSISLR